MLRLGGLKHAHTNTYTHSHSYTKQGEGTEERMGWIRKYLGTLEGLGLLETITLTSVSPPQWKMNKLIGGERGRRKPPVGRVLRPSVKAIRASRTCCFPTEPTCQAADLQLHGTHACACTHTRTHTPGDWHADRNTRIKGLCRIIKYAAKDVFLYAHVC